MSKPLTIFSRDDTPAKNRSVRAGSGSSHQRSASPANWFQMGLDDPIRSDRGGRLVSNDEAYRNNPYVQPIVHSYAATLAARSFRMFRDVSGNTTRELNHWLIDLMARPNPHARLSEFTLKYQTFSLFRFDGEVLWHLARPNASGPPEFITVFRKRDAQPVPPAGSPGEFLGWNLYVDGVPYFADRDDVIHFSAFDPIEHRAPVNPFKLGPDGKPQRRSPARGRSALDSKRMTISSDLAMQRHNRETFTTGIAGNLAFIGKNDETNPDKRAQFMDRLRALNAGRLNEPFVVTGNEWEIKNLGFPPKDVEFTKGRELARDDLIAGLTAPLFMGQDDQKYSNGIAQLQVFWDVQGGPDLRYVAETITAHLLADEPDLWADFSTDDVEAIQSTKRERLKSARELAMARMPWDNALRIVGVDGEKFEGSDIPFASYADVPVGEVLAAPTRDAAATDAAAASATNTDTPASPTKEIAVGAGTNALGVMTAVAAGDIPRDSGVNLLAQLLGVSPSEADTLMASAGKSDVPTTPNPNPAAEQATAEPAAPQVEPARGASLFRVIDNSDRVLLVDARMAGPFEYGSTQVNLTGDVAATLLLMGAAIPEEALAEKGRETDPHVTVKFGLDPGVTVDELTEVLANSDSVLEMAERGGGRITFGATTVFEPEDKDYDVVVVAIDSPDLVLLNDVIGRGLPATSTYPEYIPHATLAYVAKGRGKEFADDATLNGTQAIFTAIQLSDVDGNLTDISLSTAAASRSVRRGAPSIIHFRDAGDDVLGDLFDIIRGDDPELQKIAKRFHVGALQEGARQIVADLKSAGKIIPVDNPHVVEFLSTRANLITSVNTTTGNDVLSAVKNAIAAGETPENTAASIREVYNLRHADARLIARQENGSALNGGRFLQMEDDGIGRSEWLTSRDLNVRESHAEIDGEIVALGEKFSNGCRYPQDPEGEKSEVIGCRCINLPSLSARGIRSGERWKEKYWRTVMVDALRQPEKQFTSALQRYFNDQRGRVLALAAKKKIAA